MTLKAARVLAECGVVAHFAASGRPGNSTLTIADHLTDVHIVERLEYPLTTEPVGSQQYADALDVFYTEAAQRLAVHLDAGRSVAVVSEGDPMLYGSYMHLHVRLADRYHSSVVAGIPAFSGATAAAGLPLVWGRDHVRIVPGITDLALLTEAAISGDALVLMKVGRHLDTVRTALTDAGRLDGAVYVERASHPDQQILPLAEAPSPAPYFSVILVPAASTSAAQPSPPKVPSS